MILIIKRILESPATLLNVFNNTNFKSEVECLSRRDSFEINNINTRTQLLDKLRYMLNLNAQIYFGNVISDTRNENFQIVYSKLPEILSDLLLLYYETEEKNRCFITLFC